MILVAYDGSDDARAETDAGVVVMGTRGLSGVKSFLLGSVSHAVVQQADRTVLVTPAQAIAERRRVRDDALTLVA